MREIPNALEILLDERAKGFLSVPVDLVEAIYGIEERVQFDEARRDAPSKIRQVLKMILDQEYLEGTDDGEGDDL